MSLLKVIFTLSAEDLSPEMELGVDGTGRRVAVVEAEDMDEGVSGMEEKLVLKVDVPVVGREDVIGEPGEWGVMGDPESRSCRDTGSGGGNSRGRPRFV
jgi:hypothetical protein